MLMPLIFSMLFFCQNLLAQDLSQDLTFIETQNTHALPFNLPVYVDLAGNLSIISRDSNVGTTINPMLHGSLKYDKSIYIRPVQRRAFSLDQQKEDMGWIEVKKTRWELGAGLNASFASNVISVGLVPYKGARQVMIRHKKNREDKTGLPWLPDQLSDMESWSIGDSGSFQRYGGIQLFVGAGVSVINVATVGITLQNLFSVNVKKLTDERVQLTIAEEDLRKRRIQSGSTVANVRLHWFSGKRLTQHFILNLKDELHERLYRLAIKGKLDELQRKLPQDAQLMQWKGSERLGYIGIPGVAGQHYQRSEYEMDYEEEGHEVLDIKGKRSSGWFIPVRNHNKLVYQTDEAITLFWYSEMNKADDKVLNRKFLTPGKIMGARGFDTALPEGTKIGSTLAQMGMSFTREELEAISPAMLEEILVQFRQRCEALALSCAHNKQFRKISRKLKSFMDLTWEQVRDKLGFLMIEEPALIYAYVKSIRSNKKLYFKFMNEKFQSMEGAAELVM